MHTAIALCGNHIEDCCLSLENVAPLKKFWVNLGQEKLIFLKQPGQVQENKNITLFGQNFVKQGNLGKKNRGIQNFERNYHETKDKR